MNRKPFFFKQFKIFQDKTAMKVGTDGVLLGAWANTLFANEILDIGTGTGLIALMLCQKNENSIVTAIEIEKNAFDQAVENIKLSKWQNNISVIHTSIQEFKTQKKFDLIVSNPPFFNNSFSAKNKSRNIARQTDSLSFEILLKRTASLLSKSGKACFIIPFSEKYIFLKIASNNNLFLNKTLNIKGNIKTKIKRVLMEFSFQETELDENTLAIEIFRHVYTDDYLDLVQDFYFKM